MHARASKAPLGKELSALCRLRFEAPYLREMYDPSILVDIATNELGGIWWFSAVSLCQTPVRLRLPPSFPKRA